MYHPRFQQVLREKNRLHAGLPESNYPAGGEIGYDEP